MTLSGDARLQTSDFYLEFVPTESPHAWIEDVLGVVRESGHVLTAQYLIAAMLERKNEVAEDGAGGYRVGNIVYLVALVPARPVIERCAAVLRQGRHPVLLLPRKMIERGKGTASAVPGLERSMSFLGIEDFLVMGVLTLAQEEGVSYLAIWKSIVDLYNERVAGLRDARMPKIAMEFIGDGNGNEG